MNVLSLFDGISCGQIALQRAGIHYDNYYASEIDKHAIKVTQKNFPKTIQIGDVTKIKFQNGVLFTENGIFNIGDIGLLIGGSPCQGFSFAGKQLNFNDPRSKLFFEFVRLLKESCPPFFLLENVRMKKEYQDSIAQCLNINPIMINSSLVSAQNRARLYFTNIPNIKQPKDKNIKLEDIIEGDYIVDRNKSHCLRSGGGLSGASNKKRYFSKSFGQYKFDKLIDLEHIIPLSIIELEKLQTVPENYTSCISDNQRYKCLGNGWTVDVIAHIFSFLPSEYKTKKL